MSGSRNAGHEGRGRGRGTDAAVPEQVADERRVGSRGEIAFRLPAAQAPAAEWGDGQLAIGN